MTGSWSLRRSLTSLNSLGFILAENAIQLDLARQYCESAVQRFPQNPAYLDSLALVYRRQGHLQRAKELYEQAVRLSHGRQEIVAHYKELLREAGVEV